MLRRLFLVFILISTFAVAGCKISGTITLDGEGLGDVIVCLNDEGEPEVCSIMAITDANGKYVFEGFHHGTLTITPDPESEEYIFEPPSKTVTVDLFANAVMNFIAEERKTEQDPDPSEMSNVPWSTFQGNAAHDGYVQVYLNTTEFSYRWTWPDPTTDTKPVPINPVAAVKGKVFVTTAWESGENVVIALDSAGPVELWRYDFNDIDSISPPAYANGTVYIQSGVGQDSDLWAFDAESKPEDKEPIESPYVNQSFLFYAPTVYEEVVNGEVIVGVGVYMGGSYRDEDETGVRWFGGVYGFSFGGVDEKIPWHKPLPPFEQWTPAVNKDYVIAYTGSYDFYEFFDSLYVFDRLTGKEVEVLSTPDPGFVGRDSDYFSMDLAPVLGSLNNVIVINGGRLISFKLDPDNPGIGWQIPQDDENVEGVEEEKGGKQFSGQPSLANGFIYAVYKGYLHARNESDGSFVWEWQPPSGESIVAPMLVTDNLIFVSTESTTYAVDLESQTEVWSHPAGGHLALSNDGFLFIATPEGNLIAISTIDIEEF